MYCKHCGKEVDESKSFCPYCGKPLKEEKSKAKKINIKYILIALVAVLVIGGGVFSVHYFKSSSGESSKVSEEEAFKQALVSNSYHLNQSLGLSSVNTTITFYDNGTVKYDGQVVVGVKIVNDSDRGTYTIDYENKRIYTTFTQNVCAITSCTFEYSGSEVVLIIDGNRWRWQ